MKSNLKNVFSVERFANMKQVPPGFCLEAWVAAKPDLLCSTFSVVEIKTLRDGPGITFQYQNASQASGSAQSPRYTGLRCVLVIGQRQASGVEPSCYR